MAFLIFKLCLRLVLAGPNEMQMILTSYLPGGVSCTGIIASSVENNPHLNLFNKQKTDGKHILFFSWPWIHGASVCALTFIPNIYFESIHR